MGAGTSVSTTNACRMCMPLGACLAFAGFAGTVPFLHGSQGCATYIRRYLISHFCEPMDIASSSVGESATVFGGESTLQQGLANVTQVYAPQLIGVATTCLTETIGEDVRGMLARVDPARVPARLVHAPTPAYAGTHSDGYHAAVAATVDTLAEGGERTGAVAVLPGIVSAADLRHLHEIVDGFGLPHAMLPDYGERLDGGTVARYAMLPPGGATPAQVAGAGRARASVTLGGLVSPGVRLAADVLAERFAVPAHRLPLPVGIRLTDALLDVLEELADRPAPDWLRGERARLVDAYVDAHKHLAERTAVVYGDEDLVLAVSVWLAEVGVTPAVCATGGRSGRLAAELERLAPELAGRVRLLDDGDFREIGAAARAVGPDLLIGHSKGYPLARELGVPLVRVGLPVHDRVGAQRIRHLGYRGTQELLDRVANALVEHRQDASPVGYAYM